jgi:hypothetical protein
MMTYAEQLEKAIAWGDELLANHIWDAWQRTKEAHVNYVDAPGPLIMHHVMHGRDGSVMHGFIVQCNAW